MSEYADTVSYAAYLWQRVKECRRLSHECTLPKWREYYRKERREAIRRAWWWRQQARLRREAMVEREWEDAA